LPGSNFTIWHECLRKVNHHILYILIPILACGVVIVLLHEEVDSA
jgi:hypothetical protein